MFKGVDVNGENRHPLYAKLAYAAPTAVAPEEWFLRAYGKRPRAALSGRYSVELRKIPDYRDGEVAQRFSPDMTPRKILS